MTGVLRPLDLDLVAERALADVDVQEEHGVGGVALVAHVNGRRIVVAGADGYDDLGRSARGELGLWVAWEKAGRP